LKGTEEGIPWPALRAFADAVVMDSGVVRRLFEVYDQAYKESFQQSTYADFYVAAIFALAAPQLDEESRCEIGAFLVEKLVQAGRNDVDVSLEILQAAAGTMGPAILPAVLDAIASEPDTRGAWIFLWSLLALVTKSEDEALRHRVIQACVDLLEQVERGEADPGDGMNAAWTLASFQRPEHADLLQRLSEKPMERWWVADYRGALKLHQGRVERTPPPELWEEPVEEWLTSRCRMIESAVSETDEHAEETEEQDPDIRTARLLADGFIRSPVATGLPPELRDNAHLIAERLLYFSLSELDTSPRDWDETVLRGLLLDIVPRRLLANRQRLEKIVPIAEALLHWLQFEGVLDEGDALARIVRNWGDQIVVAGMDPRQWGSAKTTVMRALDAGVDFRQPQVREALLDQAVAELYPTIPEPTRPVRDEPPIPIVEHSSKPARNAPCPCGSGSK
jgi:hypothetical protein